MIRIIHLVENLRVNGRSRLLYDFIKYTKHKFEHEIFSVVYAGELVEKFNNLGVAVYELGLNRLRINVQRKARTLWKLVTSKPDVIVCWAGLGNMLSILPRLGGVPIIWSIHNSSVEWLDPIQRLGIRVNGLLSKFVPYRVVCCSQASFNIYKDIHKYRHDKLLVIENGVDVQKFKPDNEIRDKMRMGMGIPKDRLLVVFPTRTDKSFNGENIKDHATFIRAISHIKRLRQDMHVVMLGPKIDGNNTELRELICKYDVEDYIMLLGFRDDIEKIFASSDIVVLCSLAEGFGLSIVEAMACGAIPVCTDISELPNIVRGVGIVVKKKDSVALATGILKIAELNEDCRRVLAGRCVDKVRKRYNVLSTCDRYEELVLNAYNHLM
jgi:glycosyltransferase involved in cell wall biosynthesis